MPETHEQAALDRAAAYQTQAVAQASAAAAEEEKRVVQNALSEYQVERMITAASEKRKTELLGKATWIAGAFASGFLAYTLLDFIRRRR